jgi:hypothetical protein
MDEIKQIEDVEEVNEEALEMLSDNGGEEDGE